MKTYKFLIVTLFISVSLSAQVGRELYRPMYHYTPAFNWMNDPNGLVYYNGKYHLFYQYNPLGILWGNMSWGHAVSTDLINWEEKPVAIPMENGIMIFSGSVVVDWKNTSGFGINGKPPLVAIYTGSGTVQDQRIAYSNDEGLTWTNYNANPVIKSTNKQFRDPKVFWHEPTQKWIMVVGLGFNNRIRFYKSADLKHWTWLEDFGPVEHISQFWECPDFFKLNVDGDSTKSKWVLMHSFGTKDLSQYFIGDFDGEHFTWTSPPPPGLVIDDFESGDYGKWNVQGIAFGASPARGNLLTQRTVSGFLGTHLVNSFDNGNEAMGKMISADFIIKKNFISFLIGGGKYPAGTYVKLIVDEQTIKTATGSRDDYLRWKNWDVTNWIGRSARIEIVDSVDVDWGHILVDHIMQSDVMVDKLNTGQLDHGEDFYAAQSFSDIPVEDGRRIIMGWLNNWNYANLIPTTPWKGTLSIPRELRLETHNGQVQLVQRPAKELERMRKTALTFTNKSLSTINDAFNIGNNGLLNNTSFKQFELKARIAVTDQKGFSLKFKKRGLQFTEYVFDFENKEIRFNRARSGALTWYQDFRSMQTAPLIVENGYFDLHLLVDNCSAELFTASGQVVMTNQIFPDSTSNRIELASLGDDIIFQKMEIWKLDKNNPASVSAPGKEPMFSIYPNPVINNNGVTIKIAENKVGLVKFNLFDSNGKLLLKFQPTSGSMILPRNKFGISTGPLFLVGSDGIVTQSEKILVLSQ